MSVLRQVFEIFKAGFNVPKGKWQIDGVAVTATANEINTGTVAGLTADATELNRLDGATAGTAVASKAAVLDANKAIAGIVAIPPSQVVSADAAITLKHGIAVVTKAGVAVMTLADPTPTTDDFKELLVISATANAHTLSNAAGSGFNGGGSGTDVGTFGGAKGDNIRLVAYQGVWYVQSKVNVTLG